ncbi:MAG: lipopolysaccharide heptosyltransferase I, partial [Lentisphaeria bacterium]|nr:lipopolysaccharide heptosyltransferase I [Lentisphaeria bacterium]
MRFLIVKPSSLGDVLHAFPAVSALCRATGGTADWLIHPAFAPVLKYLPVVEKNILFDRKGLGSIKSFFPALF